MTIRIVHKTGVGDWAYGTVLDVPPEQEARVRRALVLTGYAVELRADDKSKAKKGKD